MSKEEDISSTVISRRLWLHLLLKAGVIDSLPDDTGPTGKGNNPTAISKASSSQSDDSPITWERLTKTKLELLANMLTDSVYAISG
jgi:hypothetical protein